MNFYKFSRKQLKTKRGRDFKEGDVLKVGKYFIEIHYKKSDLHDPSWISVVYTKDSIVSLKYSQIPQYIVNFLERKDFNE